MMLMAHFSTSQATVMDEHALGRGPLTSPSSAVLSLKQRIRAG